MHSEVRSRAMVKLPRKQGRWSAVLIQIVAFSRGSVNRSSLWRTDPHLGYIADPQPAEASEASSKTVPRIILYFQPVHDEPVLDARFYNREHVEE